MESLNHKQCTAYLEREIILMEAQASSSKHRSMGICLAEYFDNIYRGIDQGGARGVLFLDLVKACDTVCHEIRICKLTNVSLQESA